MLLKRSLCFCLFSLFTTTTFALEEPKEAIKQSIFTYYYPECLRSNDRNYCHCAQTNFHTLLNQYSSQELSSFWSQLHVKNERYHTSNSSLRVQLYRSQQQPAAYQEKKYIHNIMRKQIFDQQNQIVQQCESK